MCQVSFYAAPIKTSIFSIDNLLEFSKLIEKIIANDEDCFYIPNEFYCEKMDNGETVYEYCYSDKNGDNDSIIYFRELISQQRTSDNMYNDIFLQCDNAQFGANIALAGIGHNQFIKVKDLFISSYRQIVQVKRYYLLLSPNYDDFVKWLPLSFKNLYFHEDAFLRIRGFDRLDRNIVEIVRHLGILDDSAKRIYTRENNNEENALKHLKAEFNIECSGKGSNEDTGIFKLLYRKGKLEVTLTCNPHTKLYDGYNDYRIYFCWGRNDIENGRLIIASMGGHWK